MRELSRRCEVGPRELLNGWLTDSWILNDGDIESVADIYKAVLLADLEQDMLDYVEAQGVPLDSLLIDDDHRRDEITRADAVELAAASSLLAADSWPEETLFMPNVPKMSRAKSDSGIDVTAVTLYAVDTQELLDGETLFLASVKHTLSTSFRDLRYKLVRSVTGDDISSGYLARQMRVWHANLIKEGVSRQKANRIFYFLRHISDPQFVRIYAIGAADAARVDEARADLANLPVIPDESKYFRVLAIEAIASLHDRCA